MADLIVGDLTPRNQYTATAGQTNFTYSFPIFVDGDLKVYIGETLKTLTTDYTVSGAGTDNGGTVTLTTGAAAGDIITIYRDIPVERTSDYQDNGDLLATTLNDDLDKLTMMIQSIEYDLNNRCLRFGQFTTGIPLSEFTESDTDRAGKILGFDSLGNPNITQELGTFRGSWATATIYSLRDIIKDTSNDNIYICTGAHTSSGVLPISTNADSASWALLVDAESAATSAANAATSEANAATSETNAAASAAAAATSETNAATSATNAAASETAAATSATNAATSETNAATSATNAATSETSAAASAASASTSATNAATSETNAATSATNAATSETNAASSATSASTSATNAATSETNAAASATAASTSETNAASSATAAQAAQTAAEAALDSFDDSYLGAKASDPTLDNDGDPLTAGDLYWNTTSSVLKAYNGTSWESIDVTGGSTTTFTNKTIDDLTNLIGANHVHVKVRNESGGTLAAGTVVKATGYNLGQDCVTVVATTATADVAFAVLPVAINNNTNGLAVNTGVTNGVDTSAWTVGTKLYSDGAGGFTSTQPTSGLYQTCAFVLRSDNINGRVYVEFTEQNDAQTAKTDVAQTFTISQRGTLTTDNDGSFDMNATNNFKCTPTGNFTLTFTNIASQSGFVLLVNTGGHTVSAAATTKVDANMLATVSTAGTYLLSYFSDGTNVYMTNSLAYT